MFKLITYFDFQIFMMEVNWTWVHKTSTDMGSKVIWGYWPSVLMLHKLSHNMYCTKHVKTKQSKDKNKQVSKKQANKQIVYNYSKTNISV